MSKAKLALKSVENIVSNKQLAKKKQLQKEKKYRTILIRRFPNKHFNKEQVNIVVMSDDVKEWFRNHTRLEEAYSEHPTFDPSILMNLMDEIKEYIENSGYSYLSELYNFLEFELQESIYKSKMLIKDKQISFDMIWCLFQKGMDCYTIDEDQISAGTILSSGYQKSFFGTYFVINVQQIETDGKSFKLIQTQFTVPGFKDVVPMDSLSVKPLDEKTKELLVERGKKYEKYAINSHYVQCNGNMMVRDWWKNIFYRSDGRIMIDVATFNKRNPKYFDSGSRAERDSSENFIKIKEENLHMTVPFIKGFSFPLKKWGEFAVDTLEEIKFNDNAFDTLVLDEEKKTIISSLVKHSDVGFKDIIKGKSGGCIFLMFGPPGTGKTLTSEAIAETMHAPLYSVSVGELGINPTELEQKLRDILEIAASWKAQILIDEADIFLERRNENDIVRNAMVGVFLRLLEYHQGVLFLTTNRVKNIDEAFYSRISIALHYAPLTKQDRKKVWDNLLRCANIKGINTKELSKYNINGRQIKTTIRLAQALAKEKNEKIQMKQFLVTINLQEQFIKDL